MQALRTAYALTARVSIPISAQLHMRNGRTQHLEAKVHRPRRSIERGHKSVSGLDCVFWAIAGAGMRVAGPVHDA